ncbi:hypothetical protein [Spirosoma aerolatum]|uniref:hypothetical protein n=1 Tax=Spirosoma aerolatum TaxID=1211326 RepID=UPI0012D36B3A|nr:hypothetical protein [Spirosoma aerolatum]
MEDESSPDGLPAHGGSYKRVLMNWLLVTADFHSNYNRLVKYLNAHSAQQKPPEHGKLYAGQCPIGPLISLVNTMQQELERLVTDIDQYHQPDSANHNEYYTKLADHTRTIRALNKQANTLLQLATLPSLQR